MTTRTHRYFICPNGHQGKEITDEYDPDASMSWVGLIVTGMSERGEESFGRKVYVCGRCGRPMKMTGKPEG